MQLYCSPGEIQHSALTSNSRDIYTTKKHYKFICWKLCFQLHSPATIPEFFLNLCPIVVFFIVYLKRHFDFGFLFAGWILHFPAVAQHFLLCRQFFSQCCPTLPFCFILWIFVSEQARIWSSDLLSTTLPPASCTDPSLVVPILLYGCESCNLLTETERWIKAFQTRDCGNPSLRQVTKNELVRPCCSTWHFIETTYVKVGRY